MKFFRNIFKSIRRDAVARTVLPTLWRHDLKWICQSGSGDLGALPKALAIVAYRIADEMEEARNR